MDYILKLINFDTVSVSQNEAKRISFTYGQFFTFVVHINETNITHILSGLSCFSSRIETLIRKHDP